MVDLYSWVDEPTYSWSDEPYIQWAISVGGTLNQVWQDSEYAYAATSGGLDILDINSTEKVAYVPWPSGFSTIWASEDTIYLGTDDGVKYLNKSSILGDSASPINLIAFLNSYTYYAPTSTYIKYLHGFENKLSIVTASGMDLVDNTSGGFKSSTSNPNIGKCFSTVDRSVYYMVNNAAINGVFKVNSYLFDWTTPDVSYITGESFLPDVEINDIFITLQTASSGISNTIFVATSSGVYIFDEDSDRVDHYTTELAGTSINVTGIWADQSTGLDTGKVYTVSSGTGAGFSIFDLSTKSLWDKYTTTSKGRASETLLSEDVIDVGGA